MRGQQSRIDCGHALHGWGIMILVTRRNGTGFALNPDLVERIEATPDTVVHLVNGTKYVVTETLDELITAIRAYRVSIVIGAEAVSSGAEPVTPEARPHRHLVPVSEG